MKKILITRTKEDQHQTEGKLELFNDKGLLIFTCYTLELPWRNNQRRISRIPKGVYEAIPHQSPRFGDSIWIQEVLNRSEILIHLGNFAGSKNPRTGKSDILGCILVGSRFGDITGDGILDILNSGPTMKKLYELIKRDNRLTVEIINNMHNNTGTY